MARCALAQGINDKALQYASELWDHLEEHGAAGLEFPISAYMTCANVFDASGEKEKFGEAVHAGCRDLMARAEKIGDAEWRNWYLENVPEHRAIREMWDLRAG
jgi:hypothetical protein